MRYILGIDEGKSSFNSPRHRNHHNISYRSEILRFWQRRGIKRFNNSIQSKQKSRASQNARQLLTICAVNFKISKPFQSSKL